MLRCIPVSFFWNFSYLIHVKIQASYILYLFVGNIWGDERADRYEEIVRDWFNNTVMDNCFPFNSVFVKLWTSEMQSKMYQIWSQKREAKTNQFEPFNLKSTLEKKNFPLHLDSTLIAWNTYVCMIKQSVSIFLFYFIIYHF